MLAVLRRQNWCLFIALWAVVGAGFAGLSPTQAFAQGTKLEKKLEEKKKREKAAPLDLPLAVINVASVERLMSGADQAFESAGRPEISETLNGLLANVNDLKGLTREAPMGLMVFLNGLLPEPVGFVPVDNIGDLLKTVELGPVKTRKTGDNTYEIEGPRQTVYVVMAGKYAFVSNSKTALEREMPDPEKLTARLSASYDISASINLKTLSEDTKELFLTFLRAQIETDLQQRDNEPKGAYRIRKAAGMSNLEQIEMILGEGEELTIGWSVSGKDKHAGLEVVLTATADTEFATLCNSLNGARSQFSNLLQAKTPFTFSLAMTLDKRAKAFWSEALAGAEEELKVGLSKANPTEPEAVTNPIGELFQVLKNTVAEAKMDAAVQFVGDPPGPFSLIGGITVADGSALNTALEQILPRLKSAPGILEVQLDAAKHKGVTIHRIEAKDSRPQDVRLYGGKPSIYIGAAGKALWFAVGADNALPALKSAIDEVEKPVADTVQVLPMHLVVNVANWMDLIENPDGFQTRARNAFAKGGDAVSMEIRPIENGMRFRLQFDEAFLRLFGGEIANRVDRGR